MSQLSKGECRCSRCLHGTIILILAWYNFSYVLLFYHGKKSIKNASKNNHKVLKLNNK